MLDPTLSQIGLLMDAVGFLLVFLFGGFSFGITRIVLSSPRWFVIPAQIMGCTLVLGGFFLQYLGAQ